MKTISNVDKKNFHMKSFSRNFLWVKKSLLTKNWLTISAWSHRRTWWRWSWNSHRRTWGRWSRYSSIPWWIFRRKNADWRLRLKIWLRCHIWHINRRLLLDWLRLRIGTHAIVGWFSSIIGIIHWWSGTSTLCNTSGIIVWYWGIENVQIFISRVVDSCIASVRIYAGPARTSRIPSISTAKYNYYDR